jgi:hypothetical protein
VLHLYCLKVGKRAMEQCLGTSRVLKQCTSDREIHIYWIGSEFIECAEVFGMDF